VFVRFSNAAQQRKLMLEAIVEAPNGKHRLFYFLDLIADARAADADPNAVDPGETRAYDAFMRMVDSVRLLDLEKVVADQDARLFNTRQLFLDWSGMHGQKILDALVKEQWLRIIKDGKDIGYSYSTEELDQQPGNPGAATAKPDPDQYTLRLATRTRLFPTPETRWDLGSWLHTSMDRKDEIWVTVARGVNSKGQVISEQQQFGGSREITSPQAELPKERPGPAGFGDVQRPLPSIRTTRVLRVSTTVNKIELPDFEQAVAVFYVPQAISSILPRLVPPQPKTYMFATFVPTPWLETSQSNGGGKVMSRYIDVLPMQDVTLNGQNLRGVPVTDRIGRNGVLTTNYLSPDGKRFLGSTCTYNETDAEGNEKPTTIVTVPCDAQTLQRIWPHPDFGVPQEMPRKPVESDSGAAAMPLNP